MKNLSPEMKFLKFEGLRDEVNDRLRKSYNRAYSIEEKIEFYDHSFYWFSDYYWTYLYDNLFLESDFSTIFTSINKDFIRLNDTLSKHIEGDIHPRISARDITSLLIGEIKSKYNISNDDLNFTRHNRDEYPIINKVVDKLSKANNSSEVFWELMLFFEKCWQLIMKNSQHLKKSSILLAKLTSEITNSSDRVNFGVTFLNYTSRRKDLFVSTINNPLLFDQEYINELNYHPLTLQRSKFDNLINQCQDIQSLSEANYYQLFKRINEHLDIIVKREVERKVKLKLDRGDVPTKDEILKIVNLQRDNASNYLFKSFLRRNYLFEY